MATSIPLTAGRIGMTINGPRAASMRTTREEAARAKILLQSRGIRSILLVTNGGHFLKARPVFERVGFKVHSVPSDAIVESDSPESRSLMRTLTGELLGWLYYRVAGYI
jgi:uncharacterized SAM-binding protein YcdF (DUF218 family)